MLIVISGLLSNEYLMEKRKTERRNNFHRYNVCQSNEALGNYTLARNIHILGILS